MPEDPTTLTDGSLDQPATETAHTATNPSGSPSSEPAPSPAGDVDTPPRGDDPESSAIQNGSSEGNAPMAEPPELTGKDVSSYAIYAACKELGRPLPRGFTPSKRVLDYYRWKQKAAGDGAPGTEKGPADGGQPSGKAAPAPAVDKKDADPMVRLRAQYATLPQDKTDEVMGADWYLESHGFDRATLVDMKPDVRVQLAVTLKKRDGSVARMAGQASPRQTPRRPADGSRPATLPANKTAPQAQPKTDDVLNDAPQAVRDAIELLDDSEADQLRQWIAQKAQPPAPAEEPEADPAADAPGFDDREARLVRGNEAVLMSEATKEFPWLNQAGARDAVAIRVKSAAERAGEWPGILLDLDRLRVSYFDQASVYFAREIKGSKTMTAQAAVVQSPAVRAPSPRAASGTRELSQSELRAVASRAARDARGDARENDRLFQKYLAEARGS